MDTVTSPVSFAETRTTTVARVEAPAPKIAEPQKTAAPGPVAQAAAALKAEQDAQTKAKLLPGDLMVELDAVAGRFVQTLTDSQTNQVEWRYPNETQLAYSRAVAAYLRAMADG